MEKLLCPLMIVKYEKSYQKFECDREKCAWWINRMYHHETGCALYVLAQALAIINRDGMDVLTRSGG